MGLAIPVRRAGSICNLAMIQKPKVLLVGGPDVDARIPLIHLQKDSLSIYTLGSQPELKQRFTDEGLDYRTYHLNRGTNPLSDIRTMIQLSSIFQRQKPQIVHTYDTKPCVWGRLAARLAGVPVIIGTLPGLGSLYTNNKISSRLVRSIYQPLQKLACAVSDLTIFQNQADANQFISSGIVTREKMKIIPGSGVATELFDKAQISSVDIAKVRSDFGIPQETSVVTMISRLIRSKGVLDFAKAAEEVKAKHPEVVFLLVGADDKDSVDRMTPEEFQKLQSAVTCPGYRSDIPTVLAASDIFVFPTFYREGMPRGLLEAASMGLPLVTTGAPGCEEVVENGKNGYVVPTKNSRELTRAILRLVRDIELRRKFGRQSRRRAVSRFDLTVIVERTRSSYLDLLSQKGILSKAVQHTEAENTFFQE